MRHILHILIETRTFTFLNWLKVIQSGDIKSNLLVNAYSHLSSIGTIIVSPTATATPASNGGGLHDSTIIAALIGLVGLIVGTIIAGAFGIYQMRRSAQLQKEQALEITRLQREQALEVARHQQFLQEQSQVRDRERQSNEMNVANALTAMKQAKNRDERVQAYRTSLLADSRITSLQILNMPQPLDMTSVYVRLRVSKETRLSYRLDPDLLATEGLSSSTDPNTLMQADRMRLENRAGSALDPDEAIRRYKHCIILGDPGAGKTTLLKYLALRSVERDLQGLPDLPIYIEFSAFTRSRERNLLDFAATLWEKYYGFPQSEALTYMQESLDAGHALLLLDALDETAICEIDDDFETAYQRATDAITEVATRYHKSPIVVTARKAGYQRKNLLKGFTELEVLDFRPEDIHKFVDRWFSQLPTPENQEAAAELNTLLERNVRLEGLAANPLLLSLIIIVYQEHLDLPERRAELYNQCIETLLTKWDASRHIRRSRNFTPEHKRQLLEEVAWYFHLRKQRYFPTSELLAEIKRFLPVVGLPPDQNEQILNEITDENGLLKQQAQGWHGFLHLTLQEYFVALQASDQNQLAILLSNRCDPWWQEVILLYAGRTPDASGLLKGLLGEIGNPPLEEDIFHSNLILAGRCLAAYPTVRQTDLWEKVVNRLFDTLMNMPYSLTRLQIASALAEIGWAQPKVNTRLLELLSSTAASSDAGWCIADAIGAMGEPSLAPDLLPLLRNSSIDEKVRWRITSALAKLGERSIAFDLIPLLNDSQISPFVRRSIADALGTMGERSVTPKLLTLLSDTQVDPLVRCSIAKALGNLGERSVNPELLTLLSDTQIDPNVHASIVSALCELGEQSVLAEMQSLLTDPGIHPGVRMNIVDALGKSGDLSLIYPLEKSLLDIHIDPTLLTHITQVLSNLDEQTAASKLRELLPNLQVDQSTPWNIIVALGKLGDYSMVPYLLHLLYQSSHEIFCITAETLASLGDRSIIPQLLKLLADPQINKEGRWSIVGALGQLIDDEANIRALADFLQEPEIASPVLRALWTACRRIGVRILMTDRQVKIEKWAQPLNL